MSRYLYQYLRDVLCTWTFVILTSKRIFPDITWLVIKLIMAFAAKPISRFVFT